MHVFVPGGTGHAGSYVIPELIAAGHQLTGSIERIDQEISITCQLRGRAGFLRHDWNTRQHMREPCEDHGLGGFVGSGDRRAIGLVADRQRARAGFENGGGRARDDAGEGVDQGLIS